MRTRARELLPQVLLGLQSIVQALALELLWDRGSSAPHLFPGSASDAAARAAAVAGWLQVASIGIGIVLMWLLYVGLVLRFTWVPRTRDSIFPFAIGALEFLAIELLGPEYAPAWLAVMGVIFAFVSFATNDVFVHASRESGSPLAELGLARVRDFWVGIAMSALHFVLAIVIAATGDYGWLAASAFALIDVVLLLQMFGVHLYLRDGLREAVPPPEPHEDAP